MTVDRDPGHFQRDCLVQFDDISLERERDTRTHTHSHTRTQTQARKRTDCGSWLRPQPAPHLGP